MRSKKFRWAILAESAGTIAGAEICERNSSEFQKDFFSALPRVPAFLQAAVRKSPGGNLSETL